ncbi:hypothetical protein OAP14_10945 [Aliiglaciecola sp.]|nr:hypothetical protein [Aliiglaciecola sp.]
MLALLKEKEIDVDALGLPQKWCVYAKQSLHSTKVVFAIPLRINMMPIG